MFKLELSVADLNMIGAGLGKLTEPVDNLRGKIQSQIDEQLKEQEVSVSVEESEKPTTNRIPDPEQLIEAQKKKATVKAA